jgi:hypothetical protein
MTCSRILGRVQACARAGAAISEFDNDAGVLLGLQQAGHELHLVAADEHRGRLQVQAVPVPDDTVVNHLRNHNHKISQLRDPEHPPRRRRVQQPRTMD